LEDLVFTTIFYLLKAKDAITFTSMGQSIYQQQGIISWSPVPKPPINYSYIEELIDLQ